MCLADVIWVNLRFSPTLHMRGLQHIHVLWDSFSLPKQSQVADHMSVVVQLCMTKVKHCPSGVGGGPWLWCQVWWQQASTMLLQVMVHQRSISHTILR
jgi:hypothetical protein